MIRLRAYLQELLAYRRTVDNTINLVQAALREYDELYQQTEIANRKIKQLEKELSWHYQQEAARLNVVLGEVEHHPLDDGSRGHWIYRNGEPKRID
jgi:hypothetical protein